MKGFIINSETRNMGTTSSADAMFFYGILETGQNFIWKETQPYILGFVAPQKAKALRAAGHIYKSSTGFINYRKDEMVAVFFPSRGALAAGKEMLANEEELPLHARNGEVILESSIPATTQFLTSRNIRSSINFLSEGEEKEGVVYFNNPKVQSEVYLPNLRVLSFDIETGVEEDLLYSVSLVCGDYEKVFVLNENSNEPLPPKTQWVNSEKELLQQFCKEVTQLNPHIFTGWFVVGFDFKYMLRKAAENNLELPLGVGVLPAQPFTRRSGEFSIFIPGRAVIDGMDASVKILTRRPHSMRLNAVAHYLLGVGKTVEASGMDKVKEITRMYYHDKALLSEYNLVDSKLVLDILEKLQAIPYYTYRAVLSFLPIEKVTLNQAQFETIYLQKLHQQKIVAFDEKMRLPGFPEIHSEIEIPGGIYKNVIVFKYVGLTLLCALAYGLDPLGMAMATLDDANALRSEDGHLSHKSINVLADILKDLLEKEKIAKEGGRENSLQNKVLVGHIASLITGMQSRENRFLLPMLQASLSEGRHSLASRLLQKLQSFGKVLFSDIDTLYFQLNVENNPPNSNKEMNVIEDVQKVAKQFANSIFMGIGDLQILEVHQVFQHFYMAPQKCDERRNNYLRYCGIELNGELYSRSVPRTAIAIVHYLQTNLLQHIFKEYDVESFLQTFRNDLLNKRYDDKLVYKAKLSKPIELHAKDLRPSYGVQAALKMRSTIEEWQSEGKRKSIYYVVTTDGPVPMYDSLNLESLFIDYEHYLQKELLPTASKLLEAAGKIKLLPVLSGKNKQLDLF